MLTRILVFVFLLLSVITIGQVKVIQNQNSSIPQQEPTIHYDTIDILDDVPVNSGDESVKKKMKPASFNRAPESSEKVSITKDQEVQKISYDFSTSKNMSVEQRVQRTPTQSQQQSMDEAVQSLELTAPNSFEYHYYKFVSGNYDVSRVNHLDKAEKLRPNNTDVQIQKVAYHHIMKNDNETKDYLYKLVESKRLDEELKFYAEDLLLSVSRNGTLLTHGFDDTYSVLYTQLKFNVRKDVRVISMDMLQSDEYRTQLMNEGYKLPKGRIVDINFIGEFISKNASKKISISLTAPKEYFMQIQGDLYLSGLAFEYHSQAYDNLPRNERLWTNKLKKYPVYNSSNDKMRNLSSNYLPMLLILFEYYKKTEELEKLEIIDEALTKVSVQCDKYEMVKKLKGNY